MKGKDDGKRRGRERQNKVAEQKERGIKTEQRDSSCFSGRTDVSMKRRKPNQRTRKGKRGSTRGRDAALKQGRKGGEG